jgi:LysR family transcriptional regulator, glycine cleavage system transcriptional activator
VQPGRRPISLLALRAFEAAARRLSFTDAARELHVSQAAVSRHIRFLEASVERPLFRRLHRRVELTAAGRRLGMELSTAFLRIHRAIEAVRRASIQRLRVTVESGFASRWLVPRLGTFALAHPEIELELEASAELRTLGRDADVAIRYMAAGARKRRSKDELLFAIEGIPVIRGVRRRPTKWQSDAAVLEHTLLHDDDGQGWRSWFAAAALDGFSSARHQYFNDYSLALAAAEQGQGVALGTNAFIEPELRSGRLLRIGQTQVTFGAYYLLEARDRSTAAVRASFSRWIKDSLS